MIIKSLPATHSKGATLTQLTVTIPQDLWLDQKVIYRFADALGLDRGHAMRKFHVLGKIIDAVAVGEKGHLWQQTLWKRLPPRIGQARYRGSFNKVDLNAADFAGLMLDSEIRSALVVHAQDYTPNIDQFCLSLLGWLRQLYPLSP